jgi:general secretion pathway protein K
MDVLIAAPEVIAALPGMTPEGLNDFLKQRSSLPRDKNAIAAALGPAKAAASLPQTKSYRVATTIRFDDGRRIASEAVIALGEGKGKPANTAANPNANANTSAIANKDKEPFSILSWRDDLVVATRSSKRAGS